MYSLTPERRELIQALLAREGLQTAAGERVTPRAGSGPAPLSFGQERLWFLSRMAPESPVFNIPAAFRVRGPLAALVLERCLAEIHRRHETLRTSFAVIDGRPAQRIAASVEPVLSVVDLGDVARGERADEALRRAREEARRPFDLTRAPLLRVMLFRLDANDHLLLFSMHHIVSEVQSVSVLVAELAALYGAFSTGAPSPLSDPDVQFADFAVWQRERVSGEPYEARLAYWKEKLGGTLPSLQLPTDRPRPAVQTFAGATRSRAFPSQLTVRLRAFCREEKVTPFVVMLAAYATLLSRYTGEEDVLIGVPITDRTRLELEGLVGFFVNTLVFRCDLSGDPGFRELVRRTHEVFLGAQSNQELPFERLVDLLQPDRDLSRSPLVQVAFLYQTAAESKPDVAQLAPDVVMTPFDDPLAMHTGTSKFDASFVVWDDGELAASFEYNTDLFDGVTIERMLGHVERLLASALDEPDLPYHGLPLISEAERELVLVEWNDTRASVPDACVHELFEAQVDRTPHAMAVVYGEHTLTYRELDERANQLAHRLRELGVGPGQLVAIMTERCPEMVVGILGALKAGGAYLPLDLGYPKHRLAFMLQDAHVRVVLTRAELERELPEHEGETLRLDADWPAIAEQSRARPRVPTGPHDLAYAIYTSGSTGMPKGVELEHAGLVNLLTWHQRTYDVTPDDRATHLAGLAFDASVWELWPYLTAGSSLYLVEDEVRLSPPKLLSWMAENRITQSFVPTPLAEAVLREPIPDGLALEVMLTGGDKLHRAPEQELPFRLVNHYGPTENTVVATATEVQPDPDDDTPPPIGRPISNVQVYLLNKAHQPVPVGVPGELFIGGRSLARGYHERPELTAEKFVPDPFDADPNARMYATGDLVRFRRDGQIEFLGRLDSQVKVRGFRVELGEIEVLLDQHPAVAECAVIIRADAAGDAMLVGYTVPAEARQPAAAEELRGYLREGLPEYMVPAAFVSLQAMPLTPNGKVDRSALPEPEVAPEPGREYVRPEGELEETIAGAWREALQIDQVGATTNFFDLGGHSLLMAQVHVKLQEGVDSELSIVELFQYPTISSLAAHLGDRRPAEAVLQPSRERATSRRERMRRRAGVREDSAG